MCFAKNRKCHGEENMWSEINRQHIDKRSNANIEFE